MDEREEALRLISRLRSGMPNVLKEQEAADWIESMLARASAPCPHIRSSEEGTSYCELAQSAPGQELRSGQPDSAEDTRAFLGAPKDIRHKHPSGESVTQQEQKVSGGMPERGQPNSYYKQLLNAVLIGQKPLNGQSNASTPISQR